MKYKGEYPPGWTKEFRGQIRAEAGNKCERCGHEHDPQNGYALTVHHLDNDKANMRKVPVMLQARRRLLIFYCLTRRKA